MVNKQEQGLVEWLACTGFLTNALSFVQTSSSDDKKLTTTLKKLGVTNIPAIEEVNLFTTSGKVQDPNHTETCTHHSLECTGHPFPEP